MNDFVRIARNKLLSAWQYRWIGVAAAWVIAVVTVIAVSFVKERFQSTARIHVDTQTVLKPLMRELTAQPDIDQQVRMLARTLITRPMVEKLIGLHDYGFNPKTPQEKELLIDELVSSIKVQAMGGGSGNVYTLFYRDVDPVRARQIVEGLIELFVGASTGSKRQDSASAIEFINKQISEYEGKLTLAENKLKDFKVNNFGVSGTTQQDFFARMAALSDEVNKLRTDLGAAQRSRDALRSSLAAEAPQLPLEAMPSRQDARPSELELRLEQQRRTLDDLLRRFTEVHPDVIAARTAVAEMEQRKREEDDRLRRQQPGRNAAATNPVYQQLRIQFANAEAQVASLSSQLSTQQARLDQVRSQAGKVPQIEAELAQLNRDYEVVRVAYQRLVERRESATLGAKLDESSQLADFRVVEPATVTHTPVFPNRLSLAVLGLLLAIVGGVAAAVGMALAFPTISDEQDLLQLSKRPVMGGVSLALDPASTQALRWQRLQFGGTLSIFLVSATLWVVWIYISSRAI
jgi:polysaccharide chain length determinant protein (PEP-CTERM system associated)